MLAQLTECVDADSPELAAIFRDLAAADLSTSNIMAWPPAERAGLVDVLRAWGPGHHAGSHINLVEAVGQRFLTQASKYSPVWHAFWALTDCKAVPTACWGLFCACIEHALASLDALLDATKGVDTFSLPDSAG